MKRVIVIFLLVLGFFLLQTFYRAGQFKSIDNQFDGSVSRVYTSMPGPEDMQLDYGTDLLYISASERREDDNSKNGIYVLNLSSEDEPIKLSTDYSGEFNPHGLSIFRKDTSLYLYVINHNADGDYIESFLVSERNLVHLKSFSAQDLCCPNDLVAIDVDRFYVSNDHGQKNGFGRVIEDYLKIPKASIFYYDGQAFEQVAKPFHYANGINVSPDRTKLYLAETTGGAITTFNINKDGSLQILGTIDLGTGVDNIDIDQEGNLWVAAHPKLLDYINHVKDSLNFSPSQVFKLVPKNEFQFDTELIYQNTGDELSGSSIAVHYKDELLIGVVLNHSLLRSNLNK